MEIGQHLTEVGINRLMILSASTGRGANKDLKATFPNLQPVPVPTIEKPTSINP